jgi:hypothetical protein
MSASFAAESTGGAVTLIRSSFPRGSPISLAEALGCSLTDSITPSDSTRRNAGVDIGERILEITATAATLSAQRSVGN